MRTIVITLASIIAAGAIWAQQPAPPTKTYSSAADVAALLAKAKASHKDGQPIVIERILELAPYGANLEYRTSVGPAAVHEKEAETVLCDPGLGNHDHGRQANERKAHQRREPHRHRH